MAERPKIPRISIPGLGKLNAALINWANWIEYGANLRGRWPVMVSRTPTGNLISIVGNNGGAALFRVTTQIDGASGSSYGKGEGILQEDDGTDLIDDGTDPVEIKTHNENGIVVDSYVLCVFALNAWWVAAPDQCGHLV